MKVVWRTATTVFLIAALVFALFLLVSTQMSSGVRLFVVTSGSMRPALLPGSVAFVVPQKSYGVGDIITYTVDPEGHMTSHRITEARHTAGTVLFRVKGDANNILDARAIDARNVRGRVTYSVPYLGYAVTGLRSLPGLIIFIVLLAAVVVANEVRRIVREIQKRGPEDVDPGVEGT